MNIQQTSVESYKTVPEPTQLNTLHKLFKQYKRLSDHQIEHLTGWKISTVTARRNKLEQLKYITKTQEKAEDNRE